MLSTIKTELDSKQKINGFVVDSLVENKLLTFFYMSNSSTVNT